jgi:hypothetical protein
VLVHSLVHYTLGNDSMFCYCISFEKLAHQSRKVAGMMAPLNRSSSDTPDSRAMRAISTQLRGVKICLLDRSVASLDVSG